MPKQIRFGTLIRAVALRQRELSYNEVTPRARYDSDGRFVAYERMTVSLRGIDAYRLIKPYVSARFIEQLKTVFPLALYLALFQILILRQEVNDAWVIGGGLLAVVLGLMLFMEGLKHGLMPFGEAMGGSLPSKSSFPVVLIIAFLLGVGVTFAEPAIGALKQAGRLVDVQQAPYLYALLNSWADVLVAVVGASVGLAAIAGTIRFLNGWSLKPIIYFVLAPTLGLTAWMATNEQLSSTLALAWDCGAVTTGPVTVPLVLALGIGIASAAGKGDASMSGFGIVTLASLLPVLGVELLVLYLHSSYTGEELVMLARADIPPAGSVGWLQRTPGLEIVQGVRAIVPLVLFLFFVMKVILGEKVHKASEISYGLVLCVIGMIVFNLGLSYGLSRLGAQSGSLIPGAFVDVAECYGSPLYPYLIGLSIAVVFAWILGFGATMAEPALNALGLTVENLTNGAFGKSLLVISVSFGVGFGIVLGVLKIVYSIPIAYMILPGYLVAVVLTMVSSEEFVNVAWDSAGVTTGPVTVPLVLAMGLGFGDAMRVTEGFGILSMASIGPIVSVLATGLWIRWKINRRRAQVSALVSVAPS